MGEEREVMGLSVLSKPFQIEHDQLTGNMPESRLLRADAIGPESHHVAHSLWPAGSASEIRGLDRIFSDHGLGHAGHVTFHVP